MPPFQGLFWWFGENGMHAVLFTIEPKGLYYYVQVRKHVIRGQKDFTWHDSFCTAASRQKSGCHGKLFEHD